MFPAACAQIWEGATGTGIKSSRSFTATKLHDFVLILKEIPCNPHSKASQSTFLTAFQLGKCPRTKPRGASAPTGRQRGIYRAIPRHLCLSQVRVSWRDDVRLQITVSVYASSLIGFRVASHASNWPRSTGVHLRCMIYRINSVTSLRSIQLLVGLSRERARNYMTQCEAIRIVLFVGG